MKIPLSNIHVDLSGELLKKLDTLELNDSEKFTSHKIKTIPMIMSDTDTFLFMFFP